MNTQSNDVVKTAELNNSNEQQKIVKPIIVSRRRLLRTGAAGIPVMLTMAGVAPGEGIQGVASAASGLKYGDGGKVRARFNDTSGALYDNLVWSNANGFVVNKNVSPNVVISSPIQTNSIVSQECTFTLTGDESTPTTKDVSVSPVAGKFFTFNGFLHKTGIYYTDFVITGNDYDSSMINKNVELFFNNYLTGISGSRDNILSVLSFTIGKIQLDSSNFESLVVTNVTFNNSTDWAKTTGYDPNTMTGNYDFYQVPGSNTNSNAFSVELTFNCEIIYTVKVTESSTITYKGKVNSKVITLTYQANGLSRIHPSSV